MPEFDRLYTLKTDPTDTPTMEVTYLSTLLTSPTATIQALRCFDVGGFGRRSRVTIYATGIVNEVETPLNDIAFVNAETGIPTGTQFTILSETQTTTAAVTSFDNNPSFAPSGVTRAMQFNISPGVTAAVNDGTLAEIVTPSDYMPPTTTPAERKIWARLLEKNAIENVVTIADDQGGTMDVKVIQESARFATRYARDITNEKLIVDDDGVEWDILGIVQLDGRRKDVIIECVREEQVT